MKLFKLAARDAFIAGDYDAVVRIICDNMCSRLPEAAPVFYITYDVPRVIKIVLSRERLTYCFDAHSLAFEWWAWDGPYSSDRILIE